MRAARTRLASCRGDPARAGECDRPADAHVLDRPGSDRDGPGRGARGSRHPDRGRARRDDGGVAHRAPRRPRGRAPRRPFARRRTARIPALPLRGDRARPLRGEGPAVAAAADRSACAAADGGHDGRAAPAGVRPRRRRGQHRLGRRGHVDPGSPAAGRRRPLYRARPPRRARGGHVSGEEIGGRLHPLAVLLIARRFVGVSLLPAAALLLSAGTRVIVPLLAAALAVGVPLAVLSWSRFRYRVAGGRLELHSGVVSRKVRTIPLERLRGVDVTAPFLHRLLGLVRVEVEAAAGGGSRAELSLAAVSHKDAEELRAVLLGAPALDEEREAEPRRLHQATPGLLALGGITSMRYLLAPAAIVGFVFNLADDLPGDVAETAADAAADRAPTDPVLIALLGVAAAGAVLPFPAAGPPP